jgi:hypothetical protein
MTPDQSRRKFFRYVPGTVLLITAARNAVAMRAPQQNAGTPPLSHPVNLGGGNGAGTGQGPGPAQHGGEHDPGTISGAYDRRKDKDPAPKQPRKDLAADQKTLRDDVQRLALDSQELNKAIAQFGPKQALPAELVGKTKEIEKLAHDIAELAKG